MSEDFIAGCLVGLAGIIAIWSFRQWAREMRESAARHAEVDAALCRLRDSIDDTERLINEDRAQVFKHHAGIAAIIARNAARDLDAEWQRVDGAL